MAKGVFNTEASISLYDLAEFADKLLANKFVIETHLGLEIRSDVKNKPIQQLNKMLNLVGLRLLPEKTRKNKGQKVYTYRLDPNRLTKMNTIVQARRTLTARQFGVTAGYDRLGRGRPLFSAREIFKAKLLHELSISVALSDYEEVAEAVRIVADTGEWMWWVARGVESHKPRTVYAYAIHTADKWQFDMHVREHSEAPCFGWDRPHIFVPMSDIFATVYAECKKLVPEQTGGGK